MDSLPTVTLDVVAHVGTMNAADKSRSFSTSYEGAGLSVSVHPREWTAIAKLGGHPCWLLRRRGARLLSYWELSADQRETIGDWGADQGLVTRALAWTVSYVDEEMGGECTALFPDEEDAREEAALLEDMDPKVGTRRVLTATAAMTSRTGMDAGADAFDHLLTVYVEDRRPDLDGVWWEDEFAPEYLSAPRGVILAGKVCEWHATEVSPAEAERVVRGEE